MYQENLEKLNRVTREMIQDVVIKEIAGSRADVQTVDGLLIEKVQILQISSSSFEKINVGDIAVMITPNARFENAVVLGVRHSKDQEKGQGIELEKNFSDKLKVSFDKASETLSVDGDTVNLNITAKNISLNIKGNLNIEASGSLKIQKNGKVLTDVMSEAIDIISKSTAGGKPLVPANSQLVQQITTLKGFA